MQNHLFFRKFFIDTESGYQVKPTIKVSKKDQVDKMGLTEEQLAFRNQGIGSSEISAIADLYPPDAQWAPKPITIYARKKGLSTFQGNWRTEAGDAMEPTIGRWYAKLIGAVQLVKGDTVVHPDEDWVLATPDYYVYFDNSPHRMVEIKNVGRGMVPHWDLGVPEYVEGQVHWQSAVTGIKYLDVAASLDSEEPKIWQVEYSPEVQKALIEIGRDFWFEHVLKDIPPEPDGTKQYAAFVKSAFRRHSGSVVKAPTDADRWVHQRAQAMAELAKAEAAQLEADNHLKKMIGENAGIWSQQYRATWVKTASGGVDWKGLATALMKKHGVEQSLLKKFTRPGNRQLQIRERRNAAQ